MRRFGLAFEEADFLLVLIEFERFTHVFWEAMDFVFDDGEFVGLVDVVPALGVDSGLGGMHNKNIYRKGKI